MHADRLGDGEPPAGEDLQHLEVDLVRLGGTAVGLGVRQAEQARAAEGAQQLAGELGALLESGGPGGEFPVGEFGGQVEQVVGLVGRQYPVDSHSAMSSVGVVLSRATPSVVQTTMSSMRAPCRPAR